MKYYLIAGEASGDLHGSNLIRSLREADPEAEFRFWGGDKMARAAGQAGTLVRHYKESAIVGFWEVVKKLRTIRRQISDCRRDIAAWQPDAVIPIDYAGFNLRIARYVKEKLPRTRVFYYIVPKVWAWQESRVEKLRAYTDRLFVIFPFEVDYFRRHGIEAFYGGNPLMDSIAARPQVTPESREEFRRQNDLDGRPIVALVAGSRRAEIEYNLPPMVTVAGMFPEYQFVVTGVSWLDRKLYEEKLAGSNVRFVCDKTYETIGMSEAALVTSGTATLETALLGVPEVVCYRASGVSVAIAKKVARVRFISLVNLILDREAVRELIQQDFTPQAAARQLRAVLPGGAKHDRIQEDFARLRELVGGPGASGRVAREMVRLLKEKE